MRPQGIRLAEQPLAEGDDEVDAALRGHAVLPPGRGALNAAPPAAPAAPPAAPAAPPAAPAAPPAAPESELKVGRRRRRIRDDAFDRETEGVTPEDGLAWGAAPHLLWAPRLLTVDDPRAPDPPGFKGRLYPPQATLLAAMCALEQRPLLKLEDPRCEAGWAPVLQAKCGRVSERFSFGKTVLSLALVCAQRVPARLPELTPLPTYALTASTGRLANRACVTTDQWGGSFDSLGGGFLPEITVRYTRFLPLTVVAAAANVISQWEAETRRFTDLRYVIVENVRSLREFEQLYRQGQAADLDLLFVKAGRVTASYVVEGEPKPPPGREKAKSRSLFEALARLLEGVPVARLIIDDYDTLKLGSDDCFVPAIFTWLVSATRRQTTVKANLRTGATTTADFLRENLATTFPILGAALDDLLNKVFSLHCAPSYVDAYLSSTALGFRRVFVRGGQAAAMLRDLGVPDEIVEMVNANAVGTASRALGLEARSIGDVIRRVVGDHLDRLRLALRALARVARAREALGAKPGAEKDRETISALRDALKRGSDAAVDHALEATAGLSAAVKTVLGSLEEWAEELRQKHGKALARMRDNIREGQCQCCMVPFEPRAPAGAGGAAPRDDTEAAYVLAGCCQIIVCEPCIVKKEGARKVYIKRCPNCARDIKLPAGLVRVGAELDLEAALQDEAEGLLGGEPLGEAAGPLSELGPGEAGPGGAAAPPGDPLDELNNPKLKALVQLVRGEPLDCLRDAAVAPYVETLLDGRRNAPWPAAKPRKYLVFTNHPESTNTIHATLDRFGIPHAHLRGTRAQKDEAIRRFREEVSVLLVTAAKDCGGLHLPFISHVVFFHRVLDKNVEAQVAARGQRLGRDHNLEIVTLVNEAEAEGL